MAVSQSSFSVIAFMAVVLTVFSLVGVSLAAEAPAPGPSSSACGISPSFAVCCLITFTSFLFGSALRI